MKVFGFAMKMLKREYKKNVLFGIALVFAIVISFIFCSIIDNELLISTDKSTGGTVWRDVSVPLSKGLPFIIICFCCFMVLFASNFYLTRKTKEFSLLAISGVNAIEVTKYATYQILVIIAIATPLALVVGALVLPLVNTFIYNYLSITHSAYDIPLSVFLQTVFVVLTIVIIIIVVIGGFLYRNDLQTLLDNSRNVNTVKIKNRKSTWFFVSLYVIGIIMMFVEDHSPTIYILPTLVGMLGLIELVKQGIPRILKIWKEKKGIEKKYGLIYTSNLSTSIQNSSFLILCIVILVTALMSILATQQQNTNEYITAVISYVVIIILLVICIVYKLSIDIQSRDKEFENLWKIGYTRKELRVLVRKEMVLFYGIVLVLPMPYVLTIGVRFVIYDSMSLNFLLGFVLAYIIPTILSIAVSYKAYTNAVIKSLKRGA